MVEKMKELVGSRKFWAGLICVIITYANVQARFLDDTQIISVAGLISSWIIGQGLQDSSVKK